MIPYGGGTSVVGHINPLPGEAPVLTVDLGRMNRLLHFDETACWRLLGPGVTRARPGSAAARARLHPGPLPAVVRAIPPWAAGSPRAPAGSSRSTTGASRSCSPAGWLETPAGHAGAARLPGLGRRARPARDGAGLRRPAGHPHRGHRAGHPRCPSRKNFTASSSPTWEQGMAAARADRRRRACRCRCCA